MALSLTDGWVKANAAMLAGGNRGEVSVYASGTTDLIMDLSGYFTTADATYVYVPFTPHRGVGQQDEQWHLWGTLAQSRSATQLLAGRDLLEPAPRVC